jgi:hypothetical protein
MQHSSESVFYYFNHWFEVLSGKKKNVVHHKDTVKTRRNVVSFSRTCTYNNTREISDSLVSIIAHISRYKYVMFDRVSQMQVAEAPVISLMEADTSEEEHTVLD